MKTKENLKQNKAITLVALIITIVILLILAGVALNIALGDNGIFKNSKQVADETKKKTATEMLNLKITNVQMETYAKEQRMPTLKELATELDPAKDQEIKSVTKVSTKQASLNWIDESYSSIFTILKKYPEYEFEINSSLQLASINGVKLANNTEDNNGKIMVDEKEYSKLLSDVADLKTEVETLKTKELNCVELYKDPNNRASGTSSKVCEFATSSGTSYTLSDSVLNYKIIEITIGARTTNGANTYWYPSCHKITWSPSVENSLYYRNKVYIGDEYDNLQINCNSNREIKLYSFSHSGTNFEGIFLQSVVGYK